MVIGLCLADPNPQEVNDGSSHRTISAVHFVGRYRLVDFMLSNMVNSGIYSVAMVLNSQYQHLVTHIGSGREWDLARKSGGITLFPPYPTGDRMPYYQERDEPLQRALEFISHDKAEHVLVTEGNVICNIDYRPAIEQHEETGADITAIYVRKPVLRIDREHTVACSLGRGNRIIQVERSPAPDEEHRVLIGAFIVRKTVLLQLLSPLRACHMMHFCCEVLPHALQSFKVLGYEFTGYATRICSSDTFFYYNMEMLDTNKRDPLFFSDGRRIHTNVHDSLPTRYGDKAQVRNSVVSNGCVIEGIVENSIIFRNVHIHPGAVVRNSILQEDVLVERDSQLNWVVVDRSVIITENKNMLGYKTYPVHISKDRII